jgi:tRNA dimethylallyltransferase
LAHGRIPLLVGGTMMYFNALQHGISALPKADANVRKQLESDFAHHGIAKLYQRLQQIDPLAASRINSNDIQRIQRALEVYLLTKKSITELQRESPPITLPYKVINIILAPGDRDLLRMRIAARFEQMLKQNFLAEVEGLFKRGDLHADLPSMRSIGYRQMLEYLEGKTSFAQAKQNAIIATNQLAKRQLTWLRRWKEVHWFDDKEVRLEEMVKWLRK